MKVISILMYVQVSREVFFVPSLYYKNLKQKISKRSSGGKKFNLVPFAPTSINIAPSNKIKHKGK